MDFVIITGLSGAGKSRAIDALEDIGFYCVDNMPTTLISKFAEICMQSDGKIERVAIVTDIRGGELAGIDTCWFLRNGFADGNEPQADFEIEDLWELEQIVGSGHGRRGRKKDRQAEA